MEDRPALSLTEQLAAAHEWWRDAGVDCGFHEEPVSWLKKDDEPHAKARTAVAFSPPPAEEERPKLGGSPNTWPQGLAAFPEWWLSEPSLDEGGAFPRIAPRGPADAELMVLVPEPEAEDSENLLSGPQGRLVGGILSALGIAPERAYFAAALPRHTPMPDWPGLSASGLGTVLLHHIALARPRRLLVLGNDILPLLGHDPAQAPARIRQTSIQSGPIPTLAARGLGYLLNRADARAALWQRLLDWTQAEWERNGKTMGAR